VKKTLKKEWVAALRSGKYKQGRTNFYRNRRYCCFGVLCRVAGVDPVEDDGDGWPFVIKTVGSDHVAMKLARMNDGMDAAQSSFSQIADYIEQNL
jgi:hypothetical protein